MHNMRTPKEFSENIKKGIITTEMLNECLYSVNKRAKNYRNAKRECYGKYRDSAEYKEQNFYHKKEVLLSIISPVCIHKSMVGYDRIRVYDYEQNFDKNYLQKLLLNQVVHTNSYFDYDAETKVFFFDYYDKSHPKYLYFLFYELGTKSYHTPINNPNQYNLPVKEIGRLNTDGDDYRELISVQFVDKVISLIKSGNYTYKETESTISQTYQNKVPEIVDSEELLDYFALSEIRNILTKYAMQEIKKRSLEICKNEPFEFCSGDYQICQKYVKKKKIYKMPKIKVLNRKPYKNVPYELDGIFAELQNTVKQSDFTMKDLINVICKTIPYEIYKNNYINQCMDQAAQKMQRVANQEYAKHPNQEINMKIEELAEKCGLSTIL